ncbi:MAG: DUF4397 domain-containing protein [Chitinophagaceae bacterium]
MKIFFSSVRMSLVPLSGLLVATILFSACSKFKNDSNTNSPVSGLMSFNLAPDKSAVGIALGGNNLTNSPLAYTNYSGTYQLIYPGNRAVESYDYLKDSTINTVDYSFAPDKYYSLFVVGANGNYKNVITSDNFDSLTSTTGKAYVRYINAIPDSTKPVVTVIANGSNIINDNASFAGISDFKEVNTGNVEVKVNNNTTINASRTITLEQGKVYTILLVGIPGQTDTTKAVQIKYITNGNLTAKQ